MKPLIIAFIIILIIAFPFCVFNQTNPSYLVHWDIKKCVALATLDNDPIDNKSVPKNKEITINIDHDNETIIDKIVCNLKQGQGEHLVQTGEQIGYKSGTNPTIIKLKVSGTKITLNSTPEELAYPYQISIYFSGDKVCKLDLGEVGKGDETKDIPKVEVNLFEGIQYNNPIINMAQITGEKHNSLIVIDCSPKNESTVLRFKYNKGTKSVFSKKSNYVKYGDKVSIYLTNFNHYRYDLTLDTRQIDISYDSNALLDLGKKDTNKQKDAVATGTGNLLDKTSALKRLLEYAAAVDQLEEFIESVKNNPNPNSDILDNNKTKILYNLDHSVIGSGADINLLYESLNEADKTQYKGIYDKARKIQEKRSEIRLLTYTVKANIVPISIKSYDKLAFDLTIKDKKTNSVIEKREYEYLIIGGWQINQSFGVCGHTLFDEEYAFSPLSARDTTFVTLNGIRIKATIPGTNGSQVDSVASIQDVTKQKIIEAKSPSRISLSATTLTHLYYRGGRWGFGPALGIGVDFFPSSTNIRYLLGASLMLMDGRYRISLDAGFAFGKVSVLTPNQKVGDVLDSTVTTVPMVEKSRNSLYFGVSWNIPLAPSEKQGLE